MATVRHRTRGFRELVRSTTLDELGDQMSFYVPALAWTPRTLRRYRKEVLRLLAEVAFGSGALAVIGGTIGVMVAMTLFTGVLVGLQGYGALDQIGTSALTGFLSAFFNTREIAPLVAGRRSLRDRRRGFTAQLGAMRISEEVDALEVMGVPCCRTSSPPASSPGSSRSSRCTRSGCSSYLASHRGRHLFNGQSAAPTTTTSTCSSAGGRALLVRQGADLQRRDHPDPLLLRLPRHRRPRRCGRRGGRAVRPSIVTVASSTSSSARHLGHDTTVRVAG